MEPLDQGRRMARRRMAWWSFLSLFLDMGLIFGGLIFGPATFGAGLTAASGPLGMIIGARVAIIMSYLGASAYEAVRKQP